MLPAIASLLLSLGTSFSLLFKLHQNFTQNHIGSSHFLMILGKDPWGGNTVSSLFSITLVSCFCPSLHSCVSQSCTYCLAVFPLALPISPTNALFPESVYKTLFMYLIQYVQISTLIIVLIVYSTSGHSDITLNFQTPFLSFWKYSIFTDICIMHDAWEFCSKINTLPVNMISQFLNGIGWNKTTYFLHPIILPKHPAKNWHFVRWVWTCKHNSETTVTFDGPVHEYFIYVLCI